ncbi:AAA family ATPase (plasmid) [Kitasatospora sp. NBC_01246]|uniref:AAA family ATPase n=1 Tax=Kitasatospora sp. NBC_01246 TaxID=2903570 RepID=UPI002E2F23D8|nr:AAA family ATPase [Kitasatospora sp. NBC_01246]
MSSTGRTTPWQAITVSAAEETTARWLASTRPGDLVVLIGASGAGKTTLLGSVPPHRVVSLDALRAGVSEPGDQSATPDAAVLQHLLLTMRLRRGATTYTDSTSVDIHHRAQLVGLARQFGVRPVALLVGTELEVCLQRNAARPPATRVPEDEVRRQHALALAAVATLPGEGFAEILHHRPA